MNKNEKKKFNHSISIEYHLLHFSISFLSSAAAAGYYRKKEEWTNEGENRLFSSVHLPVTRERERRRGEAKKSQRVWWMRDERTRADVNLTSSSSQFLLSRRRSRFFCFWAKKKFFTICSRWSVPFHNICEYLLCRRWLVPHTTDSLRTVDETTHHQFIILDCDRPEKNKRDKLERD